MDLNRTFGSRGVLTLAEEKGSSPIDQMKSLIWRLGEVGTLVGSDPDGAPVRVSVVVRLTLYQPKVSL